MMPTLSGVLAFAGLAAATLQPRALEHREIMHRARDLPTYTHHRDVRSIDSKPCGILSEVYEAANVAPGDSAIVAVPPSIGIACLKSVPYNKKRDLALLDYLLPYVSWQSTLETLANPPESYLFPGVDVLYGFEAIKSKLEKDEYNSQYEVMTDLRSLYASANDNHFDYPPALLNTILFVRRGLNFVSLSKDGVKLPQVFMTVDVRRGNRGELTYHPSAVATIDGVNVHDWLEDDAIHNVANYQDPDAQYNALFSSAPGYAAGKAGTTLITNWEIPDSYTIKFQNGSTLVVENEILFLPSTDFSGIHNGEDFHERFEIPPTRTPVEPEPTDTPPVEAPPPTETETEPEETTIPGYPKPLVKHSMNSIAGYFLEGDDYKDTAVLSILSFLPVGFDLNNLYDFNMTHFILEGTAVIVDFVKKAKKDGRDKLILDLSANGGGSVVLAQQIYRLLFPDGEFTSFDRFRAHEALEAASEVDYISLIQLLITQSNSYPMNADGKPIKTGKDWFGPYTAKGGANVTAAFQDDKSLSWNPAVGAYYNGFEDDTTYIPEAPFKPENILIVTDGTCASACGILTGLLTRNYGIRTLALGGRPNHYAMQAMGGVKGSRLSLNSDILQITAAFVENLLDNDEAISILNDSAAAFPRFTAPPLLPFIAGASGGQVNSRNSYHKDDLDGYPDHFKYEAANCKLFYTQRMTMDVSEIWRHASRVAWDGASCVVGSTVNADGTIGDEALAYDERVRSRVAGLPGPGALN